MEKERSIFAENLRQLRNMAGLSQYELADAIGVPRDRIKAWELDRGHPKGKDMSKLVDFFGLPANDFDNVVQARDVMIPGEARKEPFYFGGFLHRFRTEKGITIFEAASRLNLSPEDYKLIESGQADLKHINLRQFRTKLGFNYKPTYVSPAAFAEPDSISESSSVGKCKRFLQAIEWLKNENDKISEISIAKATNTDIMHVKECMVGERTPSDSFLGRFSSAFNVNVEWLLFGSGDMMLTHSTTNKKTKRDQSERKTYYPFDASKDNSVSVQLPEKVGWQETHVGNESTYEVKLPGGETIEIGEIKLLFAMIIESLMKSKNLTSHQIDLFKGSEAFRNDVLDTVAIAWGRFSNSTASDIKDLIKQSFQSAEARIDPIKPEPEVSLQEISEKFKIPLERIEEFVEKEKVRPSKIASGTPIYWLKDFLTLIYFE